jgi:hypothetical protein
VSGERDVQLQLDRALDELAAAGRFAAAGPDRAARPAAAADHAGLAAPATAAGHGAPAAEAAALAALAAELRDAVPPPRDADAAAARGREALLAAAPEVLAAGQGRAIGAPDAPAAGQGRAVGAPARSRRRGRADQGRRPPGRRAGGDRVSPAGRRLGAARRRLGLALAAALLVLAVPAAMAVQARPGTPLWPLRQAGQQARLGLTADPVERAHLRLNTAAMLLAAAREGGGYQHEGLAARCRQQVEAALAQLDGRQGPKAAAERARAEALMADLDALARSDDRGGRREPEPERGGDRSGRGGGDRSGPGGGGGEGSGGGGSGGD